MITSCLKQGLSNLSLGFHQRYEFTVGTIRNINWGQSGGSEAAARIKFGMRHLESRGQMCPS